MHISLFALLVSTRNYFPNKPKLSLLFNAYSVCFSRAVETHFRRISQNLPNATISFVMSVCSSVCLSVGMEQLGSKWKDFHEIWYLSICKKNRLRWSRGTVLAFGTQVRGFKPGRSRRIFQSQKSSARLPSEGK